MDTENNTSDTGLVACDSQGRIMAHVFYKCMFCPFQTQKMAVMRAHFHNLHLKQPGELSSGAGGNTVVVDLSK